MKCADCGKTMREIESGYYICNKCGFSMTTKERKGEYLMIVRIYCGDDYVDIELAQGQFCKLQDFISRQSNMELYIIK